MSSNIDLIKQLRTETGAGLADVKEALENSSNDLVKARAYLKQKGLSKAAKRAEKEAKEGVVVSYIHNTNKVGALIEVNCETDFVAKSDDFINFAKEVALQVVAMNPIYVSLDEVTEQDKKEIAESVKEDKSFVNKPEEAKKKIVESKIKTFGEEKCLLQQAYFKDSSINIEDMMKQVSAKVGEKVEISRFSRFQVGE